MSRIHTPVVLTHATKLKFKPKFLKLNDMLISP